MSSAPDDKILCQCLGVSESEVRAATEYAGCRTLCEIRNLTNAGKGCLSCHGKIKAILRDAAAEHETADIAVSRSAH